MSKIAWPPSGRIPYLDGLRAYSIGTVVLGHSARFIPWLYAPAAAPLNWIFTNGRFGVRVFFVLSGFLITTLLLNEMDSTGKISISGFYERRVARIFPAFYTYLLTVLVLGLLGYAEIHAKAMVTAATYTWNYGSLWGAPTAGNEELLGHLWTVSLEEQFYLFWPACLIFCGRKWAERIAIACVALFPLFRLASYFLIPSTRGQLLMMFHTGSDQILWGAVAAFAAQRGAMVRMAGWKLRRLVPWFCAALVFLVSPVISEGVHGAHGFLVPAIRGAAVTIAPTLECGATVLLIFWLLSGSGGWFRAMLDSWPFVQLGLLSYSLYLWQSLFILWSGLYWVWLPVRLLGALAVAVISYRLIEQPLRKRIRAWFAQSQPAH
jgi:peptidoglycan/LPS O-acetylase OafA/YrhL